MLANKNNNLSLFAIVISLVCLLAPQLGQAAATDEILPLRERAAMIDSLIQKRVQQLLPDLMRETNIDMWLLISREYNEDPVLQTLLPATWLSARRTTILVFARDKQGEVTAYAIAPYSVGNLFTKAWDKEAHPSQWQALNALVERYQPKRIGVNRSGSWAHADGLVAGDEQWLLSHLPERYRQALVSAEPLAVGWLERRIPEEIELYPSLVKMAHEIIAQGFSNRVIKVGQTTSEDLVWWFRERVRELKLDTWFHPSVTIQRAKQQDLSGDSVILPGDLLHVDFGITYLRLNTDTQQLAYVLRDGETQAPDYLVKAFNSGNQLQDILTAQFAVGKTGNEVLKAAREHAIAAGLKPTIYSHPIGYHGHGAGTSLGMWDAQQGIAGSGDHPLHLNTAYSIELNNAVFIPEWEREIRIMLEEDAMFDASGVWYLDGRQTALILIEPELSMGGK
ncbi:M24 family metallopeptidase [Shewanella loihica]|uniref:Xaa-Pro aminopeptidase family enzyme n=1 Tax=Shewanella loihica (strain ATCC BAA-1088 / PV-4) TaxID=323850 RepID=A3QA73_SHELP|nr:M24 family metallopeptidase [Shewanella loihica]ABO22371.1 Xaa-Pro aminopeptidase family enzyme [Shewanella loihica PV-4]